MWAAVIEAFFDARDPVGERMTLLHATTRHRSGGTCAVPLKPTAQLEACEA
jgi:hypothetical protein